MTTHLLLDAFSCGGMAADGYAAAGFEVVALDNNPRALRHNPHHTIQGDAMRYLTDVGFLRQFDAIAASPPCQLFSITRRLADAQGRGVGKAIDLLTPTLEALRKVDVPWIVENVPNKLSPIYTQPGVVQLCGSSFGLPVQRHRLFAPSTGLHLEGSVCAHATFPVNAKGKPQPWGVYYNLRDVIPGGGRTVLSAEQGHEVVGMRRTIPWGLLKEGLPPIYTEYLGRQLRRAL